MSGYPAIVAVAHTAEVLAGQSIKVASAVLNPREQHRLETLRRPSDRADYLAAHLLARVVVAQVSGVAPRTVELAQRCPDCDSDTHGAPRVVGRERPAVSWSHTPGAVAAAAGGRVVGVDTERVHDTHWAAIIDSTMTGDEREAIRSDSSPPAAFTRLWVRKEALIKVGRVRLDDLRLTCALTARPLSRPVTPTPMKLQDLWCTESTLRLPGGVILVAGVADQPVTELSFPDLRPLLRDLVGPP